MKNKVVIFGVVVIIIGLIGIIYMIKDFFAGPSSGREAFSAENIDQIDIDSDVAEIRIHPAEGNKIDVEWGQSKKRSNNMFEVSFTERGSELQIEANVKKKFFINFSFWFDFKDKNYVDVYVPEKKLTSLAVKNEVGKTNISSIQVDHLSASSDVSKITINDIDAKTLEVKSDVGNITMEQVKGKINVSSDVGSINLVVDEIVDNMTLTSDVGSIDLTVPSIPNDVTFNGESELGSVRIFDGKGSYRSNQAKYIVDMKTDVGSINVRSLD